MAAALNSFLLQQPLVFVFLSLPLATLRRQGSVVAALPAPSPCTRLECPKYDVIQSGKGFEIRRFNYSVWMSTSSIEDIFFTSATQIGFIELFKYIQGNNDENQKIEMTAPALTQVTPSDGPFCKSSFTVSFYVPKKNQAKPPTAKGLHAMVWSQKYAAVSQFGGFASDLNVGIQAAALETSLQGTPWANKVEKSQNGTSVYMVAQYNSPFEFFGRVNEIWLSLKM